MRDAMHQGGQHGQHGQHALDRAQQAAADAGAMCESFVREVAQARVSQVINDEAVKHCDLVVMGTHGRRGFSRLTMGSNAEAVMRTSTVPVLMVRAGAA